MSAPNTDPEKQKEHHKAPLLGMRSVVIWALALLVLLVVFVAMRGNEPGEEATSPTGEETAAPVEDTATE